MIAVRAMTIEDYEEALQFWLCIPELGVSASFDSRERIGGYLERNSGLSTVAVLEGRIVGTALCGHDGRRGSLYHVGVAPEYRGRGIATRVVERCIAELRNKGIRSAFLFTHAADANAAGFWTAKGWAPVPGIQYHCRNF